MNTQKIVLSLEDTKENTLLIQKIKENKNLVIISFGEICPQDKVTVIVNGPLTEISEQLLTNYKLADNIEHILFVGGSATIGDVTETAEANVYKDVYSAKQVFNSDLRIVAFTLDTTRNEENKALLPLAYLLKPSCFEIEECGMYIESQSKLCYGKTVCDIYSDKQFDRHNCLLVKAFDKEALQQLF